MDVNIYITEEEAVKNIRTQIIMSSGRNKQALVLALQAMQKKAALEHDLNRLQEQNK